MMTKKDFEAVAKVLNFSSAFGSPQWETRQWIASELAELFANDNPNFDRDRFMEACGL